jgi:uncharacterized protein YjbI with pentapeptide repeats
VQDTFENVVLAESLFLERWIKMMESEAFRDFKQHLEQALVWAIEREDWPLVRRFANVGSYPWMGMSVTGDRDRNKYTWIGLGLDFGLIRGASVKNANLVANFAATRIHDANWTDCGFFDANWQGVRISNANFTNVDMVGVKVPGLVARDCHFTDVDARAADLRGAVFYYCSFTDVNLRSANLDDAEFVDCAFSDVDLRSAGRGIG